MVYKIGVFKNYEKFTGKHLCRSLVFNEIADWKICQNLQENTCPRVSFCNKVACWKVYQNSQENISAGAWFLINLQGQEICKIHKKASGL